MEPSSSNPSSDSDDSSSTRSYKRRRKTKNGKEKALKDVEEDRISNLPNSLLHHILSLLTTKYAARTSVLSKKWKHLWTFSPVLDFHDYRDLRNHAVSKENLNRFVSFINRSLVLHRSPKIEKFRVHLKYDKAFASDVDVWLSIAMRKDVEELDLNFSRSKVRSCYNSRSGENYEDDDDYDDSQYGTQLYGLPMNMLGNNSSLATLKLRNCNIDHGKQINWKSLKVLSLFSMTLKDDFITTMLSGCPSLESLELFNCFDLLNLHVKSKKLRKLVIRERELDPDADFVTKISAPHLQSLDISAFLFEYSIINLSSLVDCKLNFYQSSSSNIDQNLGTCTKILVELLENLRHVKDLTVGSWCLQVLSMLEKNALSSPLSSWACLRVDTSLCEGELPGIITLLRHAPLIETLVINMISPNPNYMPLEAAENKKTYDLGGENYWSSQKSSFTLALQNLKTVRIVGFLAAKREVEFLLFLLKNASVLEKMIIHPRNQIVYVNLKNSVEATQTLLSFPRCSPNAVVMFS